MQNKINHHRSEKKTFIWSLFSFFFLLGLVTVSAQDKEQFKPPAKGTSPGNSSTSLIISPNEDYLIGPSDIVEIKIEDAPELSGTFRLNSKGTLTLPIVGEVTAQKKTTEQVSKEIAGKLRGGYLVNPIVSVSVKQSNSRAFFIQGAVRTPGIFQIEGRPSLLKLITIAGGLADNYGSTAFIIREKSKADSETTEKSAGASANNTEQNLTSSENEETEEDSEGGPEYDLIKANINNLLRGNFEHNIIIQPGDIVHIPQGDVFFVAGEVKSPGTFSLKEGTTLRQAISLAQGTNFQAAAGRGIIFRDDLSGKRQEIKVDIGEVMSGKQEDIVIMPNDIVMVPNSQKKAIAKSAAKIISGGLLRSIFGF